MPMGPRPCPEACVASAECAGGVFKTLGSPSLGRASPQGPYESLAGLGLPSEGLAGVVRAAGLSSPAMSPSSLRSFLEQPLLTLQLRAGEERGQPQGWASLTPWEVRRKGQDPCPSFRGGQRSYCQPNNKPKVAIPKWQSEN